MAEIKRVPLQSVPLQDIGSQSSKPSSKKSEKKEKQIAPSIRFVLTLPESNEEKCPEFNYSQLLKQAEKKRKKEKKKDDNGVSNGVSLFEDDDDDKVLDVARYFESKYGNRKKSDYVDLGAGYDESDSFIDNTDAYDEIVPEEVTTVHGGFYVNSGPLEYKSSDNAKNLNRNNINNDNENGDDDDEDESSEEDSEEEEEQTKSSKKNSKRSLSSSDDTEDIVQPPKAKQRIAGASYNG